MTDQLITLETAKLAQEKGFDVFSKFGQDISLFTKDGEHTYYANYGFMYSGLSDGYIPAPTQSLLQKWLRETHGIHIQITKFGNMWDYNIESDEQCDDTHSCLFNSYEKALESALQSALNLI